MLGRGGWRSGRRRLPPLHLLSQPPFLVAEFWGEFVAEVFHSEDGANLDFAGAGHGVGAALDLLDGFGQLPVVPAHSFDDLGGGHDARLAVCGCFDWNQNAHGGMSIADVWEWGCRGANGRTRTVDLLFTKQLLYRLSYVGSPCPYYYDYCAVSRFGAG